MKVTIEVSKSDLKRINEAIDDLGPITTEDGLKSLIEDLLSAVMNEMVDVHDVIL